MKTKISYSLLAAAMACGLVQGQTAYTTPVGYVSVNVPSLGDATVGQPIVRASLFAGLPTSVTTNVIGGTFVASAFTTTPSYVRIDSGPLAGRSFEVLSNSISAITVDATPDLVTLGMTTATKYSVIPYWTLNTMFPSGAGVGVSVDLGDPKGVASFRDPAATGVNRPTAKSYFYYNGVDAFGPGWYDNDDLGSGLQDSLILDPSVVAYIRNFEPTLKSAVISGTIPSVQVTTPVVTAAVGTDNYLNPQMPVDLTLGQSNLASFVTTSDLGDAADSLFIYDEAAASVNKPAARTFFYYSGVDAFGPGWYDNDDLGAGLQDNVGGILKAGRGYVIRRKAGVAGTAQAITPLPFPIQ